MNSRLIRKLAWQNLSKNKLFIIPFLISSCIMMSLLFIIFSLMLNKFVMRFSGLLVAMSLGSIFISLVTFIFILYSYRFVIKRRYKEFAIYNILGLEKKHIIKMLFYEQIVLFVVTVISSIIVGYVLGQFLFLILNFIVHNKAFSIGDFEFNLIPVILIVLINLAIHFVCYILNVFSIVIFNPIELLHKEKSGEKEPKVKILTLIFGLILLGIGYHIALFTGTVLESIIYFFIAVALVSVATYALFSSLSIFILKILKKNHKYYYRPDKFLFISGMLYRIKSNAVSLATISIILTSLTIACAGALNIYNSIENSVKNVQSREVAIDIMPNDNYDEIVNKISTLSKKPKNIEVIRRILMPVKINDNHLEPYINKDNTLPKYLVILDYQYLNRYYDQYSYSLKKDEALFSSNYTYNPGNKIVILDEEYKVIPSDRLINSNISIESVQLIVTTEQYNKILNGVIEKGGKNIVGQSLVLAYDVDDIDENYHKEMLDLFKDNKRISIEYRYDMSRHLYELNGGFVFLLMLVVVVMLNSVVLSTFYKQISEAYNDQKNYQIMINVGLDDYLIKKTTKNQILWLFFLPLVVAFIHGFVSSKLISHLTFLFGNREWILYFKDLCLSLFVVMIIYMFIYILTSKIYYRIVNKKPYM